MPSIVIINLSLRIILLYKSFIITTHLAQNIRTIQNRGIKISTESKYWKKLILNLDFKLKIIMFEFIVEQINNLMKVVVLSVAKIEDR